MLQVQFIYYNLIVLIIHFQEASEVKRKSTKRSTISEKEFLEFTLKYQQILAERDSGSCFRHFRIVFCVEYLLKHVHKSWFTKMLISGRSKNYIAFSNPSSLSPFTSLSPVFHLSSYKLQVTTPEFKISGS